jgi:hypothetical protein
MAIELDEADFFPVLPRIVTSTAAECFEAEESEREPDLTSITVDDPRIRQTSWHRDWQHATPPRATPPPGE